MLDKIPEQGRIHIITNGCIESVENVINKVKKSNRLEIKDLNGRGWLMDVLHCINQTSFER